MKLTLIIVLVSLTNTLFSQKGQITKEESLFIKNYLDKTQDELVTLVMDIDDEIWMKKPAPDRWSASECMEHILLAEKAVFGQVKKALQEEAGKDDLKLNDAWLISKISDRGVKVKTPLEPQSGTMSKEEAIKGLKSSRKEISNFLKDETLPLRNHYGQSPYGKADVYQLLLVIAAHSMRHTAQMQEILNVLKS